MAIQTKTQNPCILEVNEAHERISNHMARSPALDLDDGMNVSQMAWSFDLLYESNVNGSSSQKIEGA